MTGDDGRVESSPALQVAQEKAGDSEIITLSTGIRARIRPVAAGLLDEVVARIRDPQVPMQMIPDKGREEPNPFDPAYLAEVTAAGRKRVEATLDAFALFGIELLDGIPDDGWIEKLHFLERRGLLDLSTYDLEDPLDREFVYKRFYALGSDDINRVGVASGIFAKEVAEAISRFRG